MDPTTIYKLECVFQVAHVCGCAGSISKRPTPLSQQLSVWSQQCDGSSCVTLEHEIRFVPQSPPLLARTISKKCKQARKKKAKWHLLADKERSKTSTHLDSTGHILVKPSPDQCKTHEPSRRLVPCTVCWRDRQIQSLRRSRCSPPRSHHMEYRQQLPRRPQNNY